MSAALLFAPSTIYARNAMCILAGAEGTNRITDATQRRSTGMADQSGIEGDGRMITSFGHQQTSSSLLGVPNLPSKVVFVFGAYNILSTNDILCTEDTVIPA